MVKRRPGATGDSWTVGGTLPAGAAETGAWAFNATDAGTEITPISFTIPLSEEIGEAHVHFFGETGFSTLALEPLVNLPLNRASCAGTITPLLEHPSMRNSKPFQS